MKGKCLTAVAMLTILMTSGDPAHAQARVGGIDGCTLLAALVYSEVTHAGAVRSHGPGGTFEYTGPGEVKICDHAARAVTRAFSKSLQDLNIYVSWGRHFPNSGDYCDSHYLDQCYPSSHPYMPPMTDGDYAFVMNNWRAIVMALAPTMSGGTEVGVSHFDQGKLRQSLRRSLGRQRALVH